MLCSPNRAGGLRPAVFFVLLCAWVSSPAFTYVMMNDGDLLDQAPLVVLAQVIGARQMPGDPARTGCAGQAKPAWRHRRRRESLAGLP